MSYRYFNPNPKSNSAGDCVVRMISRITGMSWLDAYLAIVEKGIELGDMPSANHVWFDYLRDLGFKRHVIPDTCPACYSFEDFALDHPKGTYVVGTGTHVATIIDGTLYDSWNSLREVPVFYFSR